MHYMGIREKDCSLCTPLNSVVRKRHRLPPQRSFKLVSNTPLQSPAETALHQLKPAMKILFLLSAILVFLFQMVPGNAYPSSDTMECRMNRGFCKYLSCPGISQPTGGTCRNGDLICCKNPWADSRRH
ncbi:gallinacin-9-like [Eublepharis macularius]|uniref:Gallinacin-9-like n=1 Tax=Eublepharis macularius TaxID=481883 RepID=A0AA97L8J6_EUBMA|nr:gallinacin-9-like [Eublepharis macularius]